MVLSSESDDYKRLRQTQRETWASIDVPGVRHFFFVGDETRSAPELIGDTLYVPCSDGYDRMGYKTKLALDFFADAPETFVFRTNATSYVDKAKLLERAQHLPDTGCYSGISGGVEGRSFRHVDGGGIFWSRDCSDKIRSSMKNELEHHVDDGEFAIVLKDTPIIEGERYDYFDPPGAVLRDTYLYRCRHIPKADANKSIEALLKVHAFKQSIH